MNSILRLITTMRAAFSQALQVASQASGAVEFLRALIDMVENCWGEDVSFELSGQKFRGDCTHALRAYALKCAVIAANVTPDSPEVLYTLALLADAGVVVGGVGYPGRAALLARVRELDAGHPGAAAAFVAAAAEYDAAAALTGFREVTERKDMWLYIRVSNLLAEACWRSSIFVPPLRAPPALLALPAPLTLLAPPALLTLLAPLDPQASFALFGPPTLLAPQASFAPPASFAPQASFAPPASFALFDPPALLALFDPPALLASQASLDPPAPLALFASQAPLALFAPQASQAPRDPVTRWVLRPQPLKRLSRLLVPIPCHACGRT